MLNLLACLQGKCKTLSCIILVELACNMQHATCNHDQLEHALEIKMDYMYCILTSHALISNNFIVTLQK